VNKDVQCKSVLQFIVPTWISNAGKKIGTKNIFVPGVVIRCTATSLCTL